MDFDQGRYISDIFRIKKYSTLTLVDFEIPTRYTLTYLHLYILVYIPVPLFIGNYVLVLLCLLLG